MILLLVLSVSWIPLLAAAAPVASEKRQTWTGIWSEEFSYTGCKPVIFIWARQTSAPGNMVRQIDPALLKPRLTRCRAFR
jgi:hypothetical protein